MNSVRPFHLRARLHAIRVTWANIECADTRCHKLGLDCVGDTRRGHPCPYGWLDDGEPHGTLPEERTLQPWQTRLGGPSRNLPQEEQDYFKRRILRCDPEYYRPKFRRYNAIRWEWTIRNICHLDEESHRRIPSHCLGECSTCPFSPTMPTATARREYRRYDGTWFDPHYARARRKHLNLHN